MKINHWPKLNVEKVEKLYSEKDGVPVKYVCTSAKDSSSQAMDIFYRETPHPEFGNKYFGLFYRYDIYTINKYLMITNADAIEGVEFHMALGSEGWDYSQHRHDFREVTGTGLYLDGGRAYGRMVGDLTVPTKTFVIRDGEFVEKDIEDEYYKKRLELP